MALIVNGEKIEDAVIQKEAERLRPDYEKAFVDMDPKEREAQLLDWSRENVIERILLKQELKDTRVNIPQEQVESALARLKKEYKDQQELYQDFNVEDDEKMKEAIELMIKTDRKFDELCQDLPKPSQADIEKYYEENKEQFKSAERVRVAHIVKYVDWQTDEATAYNTLKQAQEELKNGAAFEVVVDKYTDCADRGGNLGYISRGQLVEEFEDVVFNLSIGQVSDIFRTRFGFHIAKVYDRKPGLIASLNEVKKEIVDELIYQRRDEVINEFIDQLKSKAKIEEI
ncbi:MAG: peptidylprolyl isomerase [Sedimentisphaerales bacterium]